MGWISLCETTEVAEGAGKYVEIDGFQIAVFLHNGKFFAMDNTCPHAGGELSAGWIDEGCAVCPWHAWSFHLESGELRGMPGVTVRTYPTRLVEREGKPAMVQAELPVY